MEFLNLLVCLATVVSVVVSVRVNWTTVDVELIQPILLRNFGRPGIVGLALESRQQCVVCEGS
jgi:hypothetical protein